MSSQEEINESCRSQAEQKIYEVCNVTDLPPPQEYHIQHVGDARPLDLSLRRKEEGHKDEENQSDPESTVERRGSGHEMDRFVWMGDQRATQDICRLSDKSDIINPIRMTLGGITLTLEDAHLWKAFNTNQTEMIINRNGRRMFPYMTIVLDGLKKQVLYEILFEILPADGRRYKFINNEWVPIGGMEEHYQNPPYIHPDSPLSGCEWMSRKISFARVKLTNNKETWKDNVILNSMHKYVPLISVLELDETNRRLSLVCSFCLRETSFIAVTAYQNNSITKLKIQNNPFAKAFRGVNEKKQKKRQTDIQFHC